MQTIIIVITESHSSSDSIRSKPTTQKYAEGWDAIFGPKHPGTDFQHGVEDSNRCSICKDKAAN